MTLDITPQGAEIMAARIAQQQLHIDGLEQQITTLIRRNTELYETIMSYEHQLRVKSNN